MSNITDKVKAEAKGFNSWQVENVVDFPDKVLPQCEVIIDSEHGEVLTAGGILQLTGRGKIGKSMLLLNVLFGLATGRDALGFGISKPRKAVYLNGENSSRTMQGRLRLLRDYYCIDDEQAELLRKNLLFVNGGFSIQKPDVFKDVRGNLAEIRPDVLVIDPLKNFYSGEENSADDMRMFVTALRLLAEEFGLAIIVIHHTGKNQRIDIYSGRGSSLLADDAETTIAFYEDTGNKGAFNLSVTGRNCDDFTQYLIKQPERWYLYSLADKPEVKPNHILIEILEKMSEQFKTGQFEDLASHRGISKRSMYDALKSLENAGYISRVKRGLYHKVSAASAELYDPALCTNETEPILEVQEVQLSADCSTEHQKPESGNMKPLHVCCCNGSETGSEKCKDLGNCTCNSSKMNIALPKPVDEYGGIL